MSSRIESLATTITDSAQQLQTMLAQHGIKEPSFSATCPPSLALPPPVEAARNALLHTAIKHTHLITLHFIQEFNITHLVPPNRTISFAALSTQYNVPEADVRRLIHHAMTIRVFNKPAKNEVTHTRASILLRQEDFHDWIRLTCTNNWPGATKGFALANNGLALYNILSQSPTRTTTFAASKRGYISGTAMGITPLVTSIQPLLSTLPADSVVVNISGAQGDISFALLRPALCPGVRVLIHDHILEPYPAQEPMWKRRLTSNMDVNILQLLNTRERDEAQWHGLLQEADEQFQWVGVQRVEGSALAVVEVVWMNDY
ncbi:uncharacterized protein BO87DRAFT_455370 [Aspergillus neoniger CBS 115656]|uniref:O-methyltransferase n=1 Tax=Aspergillus neoniger (strain CBS 115656) TaxID=1448310 RepID=A0A318YXE0_ASPNB|nr:hypothetical protein BO87DRAFT_455370 [Aspergillus neoniger CBS 115656]PYH38637.1 hypothetical protein BO87DRAFT_455370 [Aspergillus neoniger CBS 115656]